ncbi:unnamed protein product, partial [Pleuronectes platessa]
IFCGLGHCDITPGQCDITPGLCDITPVQCIITPGHCDITPGQCDITPGHCDITPGQCGITPGHCDITAGHCDITFGCGHRPHPPVTALYPLCSTEPDNEEDDEGAVESSDPIDTDGQFYFLSHHPPQDFPPAPHLSFLSHLSFHSSALSLCSPLISSSPPHPLPPSDGVTSAPVVMQVREERIAPCSISIQVAPAVKPAMVGWLEWEGGRRGRHMLLQLRLRLFMQLCRRTLCHSCFPKLPQALRLLQSNSPPEH